MPVSTETHCDQCGKPFQLKRNNKTGFKFCGNTCRQRAHRAKGKTDTTPSVNAFQLHTTLDHSIEVILEGLRQEVLGTRSPAKSDLAAIRAGDKVKAILRNEVKEAHMSVDKKLQAERQNADFWRKSSNFWQERVQNFEEGSPGLSGEAWDNVSTFSDTELRTFVKIVARTARNEGVSNPLDTARRWVEGNRPALPEKTASVTSARVTLNLSR